MSPERGAAPVHIRLLAGEDSLAELTDLLHRAYAPLAKSGMRYLASWQDEAMTRRRVEQGECYVAVSDRIAGTILFHPPGSTIYAPHYEEPGMSSFHQFAVDPDLQGRGIGGLLLETVERRARETGASEIALDTAETAFRLISLYAQRGYQRVAQAQWDETNYRSVIMSKKVLSLAMIEFLTWVAVKPRTYEETMEAWRSTCPRLALWEDALADGLVQLEPGETQKRSGVRLTSRGRAAVPDRP